MTRLPDVVPWLLVLDLVTAAIAMLPYRETTAVRAEYLDSLNQTIHPRGHQARHPAKLPLPTSANEQRQHRCGESPDELDERLAGTPLAHAPDAVPAMSRDTAENTGQPAQSPLTATSRNDDPDLL